MRIRPMPPRLQSARSRWKLIAARLLSSPQ
jgi:hypothetical protein